MYIFMCMCIFLCMCICIFMCMYVFIYICMYVCVCVYVCVEREREGEGKRNCRSKNASIYIFVHLLYPIALVCIVNMLQKTLVPEFFFL